MSSVGSSNDRSSPTDEIRRNRDSYQQRETDTAKRTSQQIKRLNEAHEAELEEIKGEHARDTDEMKVRNKDTMSRRDLQYQKEMDELRDLHKSQVQRLAMDAEDRQKATETALKGDVNRITKTTDSQKKILMGNYENQLRSKDETFAADQEQMNKAEQSETQRRVNISNRDTDEKVGLVTRDRDEQLEAKQQFADSLRHTKDLEIERLKRDKASERTRLEGETKFGIERERENNRVAQEDSRAALVHDKKNIQSKYQNASEKLRVQDQMFRDELADTVNNRLDNRSHVFEQKAQKLQEDEGRGHIQAEHEKARQIDDVKRNLGANIDQLQNERGELVSASARRSAKEVEAVNKRDEKILHEQNAHYQDKMALDADHAEERLTSLTTEHDRVLGQERGSNNSRFEKLKTYGDLEQAKQRTYFERATDSMKENFETTLHDVRDRTKRDQDQLFAQFAKQSQDNDAKFQQKLTDLNVRYAQQINEMQDGHVKDLKDQQTIATREKAELVRKADVDLRTQAAQYDYRLAKTEEQHKKEIEQLNKRHEETLANLTKNRQA